MDDQTAQRLMVVEPVVRRVVGARVPVGAVDDLVQATMERLADAAQRLSVDELTGYAVVAAENASRSFHRTRARRKRLQHRLAEPDGLDGPEGAVVAAESAAALRRAMEKLEPPDAALLSAHHVEEHDLATLARRHDRTEMAIRVQLARARARLRVAYAVEDAGTDLPSERCRRVLDALSSGDRRAQERLDAEEHLASCPVCRSLVTSVVARRRPVVALVPALAIWWRSLPSAGRRAISASTGALAVAAAVGSAAVVHHYSPPPHVAQAVNTSRTVGLPPVAKRVGSPLVTPRSPAKPAPSGATSTSSPQGEPGSGVGGRVRTDAGPVSSSPGAMAAASGAVTVTSAAVLDVPADEGFWVAADDGGRIWVQIVAASNESPVRVAAGSTVSFTGRIVSHDSRFAAQVGVEAAEGAGELTSQAHHLEVDLGQLRLG